MDIFVTGPSGELGRPTISGLVRAGHTVRGATRSAQADRIVADLGAEPVRVDLFDALAVREAVADAEVILHLATAIPPSAAMGDLSTWEANDRLRAETTAHLTDAARANGVRSVVLQSYFAVQAPGGEAWIENDPAATPTWSGIGVMETMQVAEETLGSLASSGTSAVVLRFGSLYSGTSEQLQAQVAGLRAGAPMIPGEGANRWPFVVTDDAARAVIAALELGSGSFDVADDEPLTLRSFYRAAAEALDVPEPGHVAEVSGPMADILLGSWRVSNRPFAEATGWSPTIPSALQGWPAEAERYLRERLGLRPV